MSSIREEGRKVIELEASTLQTLAERLDESFDKAVETISACGGKTIISGMGKAGIIARKIAATFSSLGTSSFFMHPAEAVHGDLGMLTDQDIIVLISNSGESREIKDIIPAIKSIGITLIAICGKKESVLGKEADILLDIGEIREACRLGLAPTSSTTAILALGDALAVVLMNHNRDFSEENYAFYHPAGSLGKKVTRVADLMRTGDECVIASDDSPVKDILLGMTKARAGCAVLVDGKGRLSGFFSDGDLRRSLDKNDDLLKVKISSVMIVSPKTIDSQAYAMQALKVLKDYQIGDLPVVDGDGKPVGVLSLKDLIAVGIV